MNLHENISVSDYVKAETEMDAVIYRQQFEKYRRNYLKTKSKSELIFCFIFLQIYIECFLHQNMRRIIELEFKPPRDNVCTSWLKKEHQFIPKKIDDFTATFFSSVQPNIQKFVDCIKYSFTNVGNIRNLLAHGHKVSSWSDSNGNSGTSPTPSFLTESQLNQSVSEVNKLGVAWNDLLDNILPQCKALRRVDDFKFLNIYNMALRKNFPKSL
ncbi:MAG: hypothetical protein U9P63_01175 [Patescibacteria group bacterium]|nr:hypothetical protein [Patescibacteria group bacterium]